MCQRVQVGNTFQNSPFRSLKAREEIPAEARGTSPVQFLRRPPSGALGQRCRCWAGRGGASPASSREMLRGWQGRRAPQKRPEYSGISPGLVESLSKGCAGNRRIETCLEKPSAQGETGSVKDGEASQAAPCGIWEDFTDDLG